MLDTHVYYILASIILYSIDIRHYISYNNIHIILLRRYGDNEQATELLARSTELLKQSAELGRRDGMALYGMHLETGVGVEPDVEEGRCVMCDVYDVIGRFHTRSRTVRLKIIGNDIIKTVGK